MQSDPGSLAPPSHVTRQPLMDCFSFRPARDGVARVLHAARDPERAADVASLLAEDSYCIRSVHSLDELLEHLLGFLPDILLVDDDFRDLNVAVLCSQVHLMTLANQPRIVFLCAGEPEEEATATALLAGVDDYVSKERGTELRARIHVALRRTGQFLTLARVRRERNALQSLAYLDGLTGIPNRRSYSAKLESLTTEQEQFAVLFIDIDHFKAINDHYGHGVGDVVLRCVARVLREGLHEGDFLFRYGGEEFVVLAPGATRDDAAELAERLRARVARLTFEGAERLRVTVSVGADALEQECRTVAQVLAAADACLYQAKRDGRNRSVVALAPMLEPSSTMP